MQWSQALPPVAPATPHSTAPESAPAAPATAHWTELASAPVASLREPLWALESAPVAQTQGGAPHHHSAARAEQRPQRQALGLPQRAERAYAQGILATERGRRRKRSSQQDQFRREDKIRPATRAPRIPHSSTAKSQRLSQSCIAPLLSAGMGQGLEVRRPASSL